MNREHLLIFALIALTGCNKVNQLTTVTCSNEKGVETAKSLISDQVQKDFIEAKNSDGTPVFDQAAVRATLSKLQISFENIRTSKSDPNSTKVFCDATYKVSVPTDLYQTVSDGIRLNAPNSSADKVALKYGFSASANIFTREIDYALQPTDDRQSIFAEMIDAKNPANFLSEIIASALAKPMLEAKRAEEQRAAEEAEAQAQAAADQQAQQKIEQQQATLEAIQQENLLAKNALNQLWSVIPKERQGELSPAQTAWVQKKNIDCQIESAEKSTDPTQNEIDRLSCDTSRIRYRVSELRQAVN